MRIRRFLRSLIILLLGAALAQCQQLTVHSGDGKQSVLSRADIEALPRARITATTHEGAATFEGVLLKSILERAGVPLGDALRGKRLASYLLVEAADGYRVVFALPELDPSFTEKQTVLVLLQDGKALDTKSGPYRIIVPDEKKMARWVRQVTTLKIVDVQ